MLHGVRVPMCDNAERLHLNVSTPHGWHTHTLKRDPNYHALTARTNHAQIQLDKEETPILNLGIQTR